MIIFRVGVVLSQTLFKVRRARWRFLEEGDDFGRTSLAVIAEKLDGEGNHACQTGKGKKAEPCMVQPCSEG